MKQLNDILNTIALKHDIKILYACETGSRAWGFPSPDSDYDVRFIYMHHPEWYLSLNAQKDSIEYMDAEWDITGWDLRKALLLMKRSNAALIERFQSPIVYHDEAGFRTAFSAIVQECYNPTAVFYHYYSLCNNFFGEMKEAPEVRLKSLMYILRSILCCLWAVKDNGLLPMEIKTLLKYAPDNLKQEITTLIHLKAGKNESYMHVVPQWLMTWIDETLQKLDTEKSQLKVRSCDIKNLNAFFLKMWYENNNNR
jgi:predicted nucleotidyltransferase